MLELRTIDSLDLPELQPYRTMRRQMDHRRAGIFVAEGEKVVRRLLESNFEVISLLLPEKWLEDLRPLVEARPETVHVFLAEKRLLESLTGFSMYQGLLALGRVPAAPTLAAVLAASARPSLFAAVEGLSSADNLGAIIRNAAGFGVQALLVGETCTSPYLRRAVRSSMGAVFKMPIIESHSLLTHLRQLNGLGVSCVAAHPHVSGRTLPMAQFNQDCCLVFGSEGYGLTKEILAVCHDAVAIPMANGLDSLNVGSAAAAVFYEAARQRGNMHPPSNPAASLEPTPNRLA